MSSKLDDLVTIDVAARTVKMNREKFRRLCKDNGIGVLWGGSAAHPRLRVKMSDVERVLLNRRFVPEEKQAKTPRRRKAARPLNPLVNC